MRRIKKYFSNYVIIVFLVNILLMGFLIFHCYEPEYIKAIDWTQEMRQEGREKEVAVMQGYNFATACCMAGVCVMNLALMCFLFAQEMSKSTILELEKKEHEKVLAEKNNEIMRYAKISSVGRVLTDIIHQWKQPLNRLMLIISNMELAIQEDEEYSEEVLELAGEAKKSIKFLSDTITEFRSVLAHEGKTSAFELDEAVSYVTSMFGGRINENKICCTIQYEGNLRIFGKKNLLIQTLMNLVDNALDAIESEIELKDNQKNELWTGEIQIRGIEVIKGVEISVWDNGGEIPEEDLERIFRLYHSSKGEKGSGLGLTISRNIIQKDFSGELMARNRDGGVEFVIFLPRYGGDKFE